MSGIPDQMIELAQIPGQGTIGTMPVHRDYDTILIGAGAGTLAPWRLDLDSIGQLQVALDQAVTQIRGYQQRMED